jgi:hypothetical protein
LLSIWLLLEVGVEVQTLAAVAVLVACLLDMQV